MYTREMLDALPNKAAVAAVAENLGLSSSGSRAAITDRVLAAEDVDASDAAAVAAAADATDAPEPKDPEDVKESPSADAPEPDATWPGFTTPDPQDPVLAGAAEESPAVEAVAPSVNLVFSDRARQTAARICASYLGSAGFDDTKESEMFAGLTRGLQPVIVRAGKSFKLEVRERPFHLYDVTRDVPTTEVLCNVARRLATMHLYPKA